jgi:hypothetical protein
MRLQTYEDLLEYIPESLHDQFVVAGGYACCPELAGDIDMWLLVGAKATPEDTEMHMEDLRGDLYSHLHKMGASLSSAGKETPEYLFGKRRLVGTIQGFWKTGGYLRQYIKAETNLQFIIAPCDTAQELVDSFDLSTHAIAFQGDQYTFAKQWTRREVPPVVMRWDQPATTLKRIHKICARYGTVPRPGDVERLTDLAESEAVVAGLGGEDKDIAA